MTDDSSRAASARRRQERWEHHMYSFCLLDNHLNVEMETAPHQSTVLTHVVDQTNRVKNLWYSFQREPDNGCVLEDTAVQMAIDQHGLQSPNFHQPQMQNKRIKSQPLSKPPDIDCEEVFNQGVSAAIVANGLMTASRQDNYM